MSELSGAWDDGILFGGMLFGMIMGSPLYWLLIPVGLCATYHVRHSPKYAGLKGRP
jgi:hypothetical protein